MELQIAKQKMHKMLFTFSLKAAGLKAIENFQIEITEALIIFESSSKQMITYKNNYIKDKSRYVYKNIFLMS